MPLYSPGVCPQGQDVVEVTEIHANKTDGGVNTSWQGSCCSSGMTFGSDISRFCQSTISSPLRAHAILTTISDYSGATTQKVYEWTIIKEGSASTVSNMTSISIGLAVAGPVVVAWNREEMLQFPAEYRTSLASKIGVVLETGATPASTSELPRRTGDSPPNPPSTRFSSGVKAGISVGAILGAAIIVGTILLLWFRKRKRRTAVDSDQPGISEMEDQDAKQARMRWFLGGRWRSEVEAAHATPTQELDSKVVHVVPGPPAELDSSEIRYPDDGIAMVQPGVGNSVSQST